jgi:uncharacterized protein YqeY
MAEAPTFIRMKEDMKDAMRAKEADRLGSIRMLISALKNKAIELRRDVTEEEILEIMATEAKKRRESIDLYTTGERPDLVAKEEADLVVIAAYLPEPLSEAEVVKMIEEIIAETGASTKKDIGKVMGKIVSLTKGRFDGGQIKDLVMARLD